MPSYKLFFTVISFISLLTFVFLYNYFTSNQITSVYNIETNVVSTVDTTETTNTIEEKLPDSLQVTLSGEVKNILAKSHSAGVIVYLEYINSQNKESVKAVSLDFDSKYKFENIQIKPSSIAKIYIKSDIYVFYPASYKFEVNEKYITNNFEANIAESTKKDLTISGNIVGLSPNNGVVYLYGTSVVDNKAIKTLVPINNEGFVVESIDSGSYLVIPSSENYLFFPKTKNVYVKNKPVKLTFFAIKRFKY